MAGLTVAHQWLRPHRTYRPRRLLLFAALAGVNKGLGGGGYGPSGAGRGNLDIRLMTVIAAMVGTMALVPQIVDIVRVPVVAVVPDNANYANPSTEVGYTLIGNAACESRPAAPSSLTA